MPTPALSTWSEMLPAAGLLALAFGLSLAGTGALARWLGARGIMDRPNERSSHSNPTPRGGGLAVIGALAITWPLLLLWLDAAAPPGFWMVYAVGLALAAISFADDLTTLGAGPRFAAQIVAVALTMVFLEGAGPVFQGLLPLWLDRLLAAVAWLWFVNLYNFMDGIDGITGVESAALGIGLALVFATAGLLPASGLALLVAGAAVGFLVWNWQPARIFMGDVGSIPLGFLTGWLLLLAAAEGQWAAALILPAYYWCDATITLLRRAARGERIWRAHRQHFYQRAVQRGLSHAKASGAIALTNAGLIMLAVLAMHVDTWIAIGLAAPLVARLLWRLARGAGQGQHA